MDATRAQCVECHTQTSPGWVHSWQKSVHSNLDDIRKLPDTDSRAYKKGLLTEVEGNLRSMGLLKEGEPLKEVGCIDCHMGVNKDHGQHKTELNMPDAATCGQCHVKAVRRARIRTRHLHMAARPVAKRAPVSRPVL